MEPKSVQDLEDPKAEEAKQEELYTFSSSEVRNKARLVTHGYTQEEGIDYDEVFSPVARIEAIRLFLAYASFMGFIVYQMDMKSAFLYGTIDEENGIRFPGTKYISGRIYQEGYDATSKGYNGIPSKEILERHRERAITAEERQR
ncbi:putative ribonuclease H-like domain-containing protein [Tanacetum coccineum]